MNTDVLKGKRKQMRGDVKKWWGNLTDDDFDATEDERGADEPGRGPRIRPRSPYDDELA